TLSAMLLMSFNCRPDRRTPALKAAGADADPHRAMSLHRSFLLLLLVSLAAAAGIVLPATGARAASLGGWNLSEQHAVRVAGVMHDLNDQAFHGERALAGRDLPDSLAALATTLGAAPARAPASAVSVTT